MRLFHLTNEPHWMMIAQCGEIVSTGEKQARGLAAKPGETLGLGMYISHTAAYLDPVDEILDRLTWLTENGHHTQRWQEPTMGPQPLEKGAIRIEVDFPHVERWMSFRRSIGFPAWYAKALNETGGGQERLWWVTDQPIGQEFWVQVVESRSGSVLYDRAS